MELRMRIVAHDCSGMMEEASESTKRMLMYEKKRGPSAREVRWAEGKCRAAPAIWCLHGRGESRKGRTADA